MADMLEELQKWSLKQKSEWASKCSYVGVQK